MPSFWSPSYRDENLTSRYPFSDGSLLVADSGLAVDVATFTDASIYPIGVGERCGVSAITVSNRLVVIWVGDIRESRLASGRFDPLLPPSTIPLEDAYGRPAGMLLADPLLLAASQAWPSGTHTFATGMAEFVASCVVPTPEVGVRGFLTEDGDLLTGDVWWVGERGVVVRKDGDTVRIDEVGDPLFARRLCFPLGLFLTPRFVKTINGIPPGPGGDFQIIVGDHLALDTVLRIYPRGPGELVIEAVGERLDG